MEMEKAKERSFRGDARWRTTCFPLRALREGRAGEEGSMGTSPDPETRPTCNHHGSFRLYVLLFPRALIELLLPQRHLVGFHVPPLRVLWGKVESLA